MAWEHSSDKKLNKLSAQNFLKLAQEAWVYLVCRIVTQPGEGERGKNQPYREAVHLRCQGLPSKPTISGSAGSTGIAGDSGWCVAPRRWPDGFACSSDGVNCGMCLTPRERCSTRSRAAVGTMVKHTELWLQWVPWSLCLLFSVRLRRGKTSSKRCL